MAKIERDKIRELARLLAGQLFSDIRQVDAFGDKFERIVRAELVPLLDAAQAVIDKRVAEHSPSWRDRLAAELQHWRKP